MSGKSNLGAAITLPLLKLVIDPVQGGRGTAPGGCNERGIVVLGSTISGV